MSKRRHKFKPLEIIEPWRENAPVVRIIANKYIRARVHVFNNERVFAIARALNQTLWTICARAGMFRQIYDADREVMRLELDKAAIKRCIKANLWPVHVSLHFELLEKAIEVRDGRGVMVGTGNVIDAKFLNNSLTKASHG